MRKVHIAQVCALKSATLAALLCALSPAARAQEVPTSGPDAGGEPIPVPAAPDAPQEAPPEAPVSPDAPAPAPAPPAADVPSAPATAALPAPEPSSATAAEATSAPLAEAPAPAKKSDAIEVTVVGTRLSRTAGSAHVLRKKDLERFEYDDPHRILLSVPGVNVRGEDGFGLRPNISIRGVNPDRSKKVTLLEDGVLFAPAPYSAPAAYYFPLFTRMERISVLKGPGTIVNGPQTVGGTIGLTTRAIPEKTSGAADIAAGQFGYGKGHAYFGSSNEHVGFLIEGVRLQSDGFKELPNGADTGFIRNEWMVKGSYVIDPRARIRNQFDLKLTYSDELSNESYLGITDQDFKRNPDRRYFASQLDRMENHRTSVVLTHLLSLAERLSLTTNVYRHDFHRTWRKVNGFKNADVAAVLQYPSAASNSEFIKALKGVGSGDPNYTIMIGPNQRVFVSQGIDSRLRWDETTGEVSHRLEVGARYHFDSIERRHSQNGFLVDDGELVPDGLPTDVTAFNRAFTHAVALHALYAMTWRGLTLTPGVRTELIRSGTRDRLAESDPVHHRFVGVVLPGAGAFYAITDSLGVLAGVYEGFSPPLPGDKTSKPEKAVNYEGGARYTKGPMRLEALGYYNDYSNLTAIPGEEGTNNAAVDKQYSLGRARIYGVELGGEHDLPAGPVKIPLRLAYTFTRTEFLHAFKSDAWGYEDVHKGDEVPYIPRHQMRFGAGVEHARAGGNASLSYVSATREDAGRGKVSDALHMDQQIIVDLAAYAKIWRTISLYGTVQNLFDSRYIASHRPFGARPNTPRWVQVGVKGSF